MTGGVTLFEDDGLANHFPNLNDDEPEPPQDEPMNFDRDESPSGDEERSPPPMNIACCLHQEPRILFVFDEVTGDFVESYPTIFLPRPATIPSQGQGLRRSTRPHVSPINLDAAYLSLAQGDKSDATKKKKKDAKGKNRATETKAPRKRARTDDDTTQVRDKLALKKPKLNETLVVDEDEHAFSFSIRIILA